MLRARQPSLGSSPPVGSVSKTLGTATLASSATLTAGNAGNLSKTLGTATLSSSASKNETGSLAKSLDTVILSSSSSKGDAGSVNKTLGTATLSSAAAKGEGGAVIRTLATATLSSAATKAAGASGGVTRTLSAATLGSFGLSSLTRNLTPEMVSAIVGASNRPVFFYEGQLQSGALRLWNGTGPITWNAQTWQGDSTLISIQLATETEDIEATGIEVSLNGSSELVISSVLSQVKMGQSGKVWFGFLDSTGAVISTPYLIFSGLFDTAEINENDQAPEVVLRYETKLIELERGKPFRYTTENQRIFNAADRGFEYVPKIQDWNGYWGPKAKKPTKKDAKKNQKKK